MVSLIMFRACWKLSEVEASEVVDVVSAVVLGLKKVRHALPLHEGAGGPGSVVELDDGVFLEDVEPVPLP